MTKGLKQKALCHSKKNRSGAKAEGVDEEGEAEGMEVVVARNQIHSRSLVDRLFECNEIVFQKEGGCKSPWFYGFTLEVPATSLSVRIGTSLILYTHSAYY